MSDVLVLYYGLLRHYLKQHPRTKIVPPKHCFLLDQIQLLHQTIHENDLENCKDMSLIHFRNVLIRFEHNENYVKSELAIKVMYNVE